MPAEANDTADINRCERIWFFLDKFWRATKGLHKDEVSRLMEQVERFAEGKGIQALSTCPFVFVGDPYKKRTNAT